MLNSSNGEFSRTCGRRREGSGGWRWIGTGSYTGRATRSGSRRGDRGVPASGLVELVEGRNALPRGRALDLGCGTGTNSIYLSQNGWSTTGVDMVPRALEVARRSAERAGVAPKFVEGDVIRLRELGIDGDFNLLVDVGCFHTLPAGLRARYVASISSVASAGATLFLYAFSPRKLRPHEVWRHAGRGCPNLRWLGPGLRHALAGWNDSKGLARRRGSVLRTSGVQNAEEAIATETSEPWSFYENAEQSLVRVR